MLRKFCNGGDKSSKIQEEFDMLLEDDANSLPELEAGARPALVGSSRTAVFDDAPRELLLAPSVDSLLDPCTAPDAAAAGLSTTHPGEPKKDAPIEDEDDDWPRVEEGPNEHVIVDTLRQFTTLVNTVPVIEARIAETQHLLDRAAAILKETTPDVRELCATREHLELFLMAKMKRKKELWDGTAMMKKDGRKFRMEWLKHERKEKGMEEWKETNKDLEERGYSPEPYEKFV